MSVLTTKYCFFVSHLSKIAVILSPGRQEDGRRGLVKTLSTEQIQLVQNMFCGKKWQKMNDDYRASWINMCSPWEERKMSMLGLELVNIDSFCADDKLVFWKNAPAWFAAFAQWSPWNTNFSRWCQLYAIRGSNLCRGINNGTLKQIAVLIVASVSWNFSSKLWMKRTKCRFRDKK